jgi:hypothetical protein
MAELEGEEPDVAALMLLQVAVQLLVALDQLPVAAKIILLNPDNMQQVVVVVVAAIPQTMKAALVLRELL